MITKPGTYYWLNFFDGDMKEAAPGVPHRVVCRRVADFPDGRPPAGAAFVPCVECAAPVAYNPHGPHRDRPRVCMQCVGVEPLPI